jgi:hypothetical protein
MRGLRLVPVVLLAVVLQGCGLFRPADGRKVKKQTRPIVVVLVMKGGVCEARFGKQKQHVFNDDTVVWEFINACNADQNVTLALKGGSANPFTTSAPWTIAAPQDNAANPADLSLTVLPTGQAAAGEYGFDIIVGGRKFDPKLEIDP